MSLKNEIIELSKKCDIDKIGFTKLEFNQDYKNIETKLYKKGFITTFHKEYNLEDYNDYKSVIVILVNYYNDKIETLDKLDENIAYFSVSSWGRDYHEVLKEKLEIIKKYLEEKGYKSKCCVDTNEFSERDMAVNAGLGFIGLNGSLINEDLGSYAFIGLILTNAEFEYDVALKQECLKCMKCIHSCPTKAINEEDSVNGNKCLSYLTQKKQITESEKEYFNNCIYGCDICMKVCPHNKNLKNNTNFKELGIEFIDVREYKSLSNKEFKEKYGVLSGAWRGKSIIERNINIVKEKLEK